MHESVYIYKSNYNCAIYLFRLNLDLLINHEISNCLLAYCKKTLKLKLLGRSEYTLSVTVTLIITARNKHLSYFFFYSPLRREDDFLAQSRATISEWKSNFPVSLYNTHRHTQLAWGERWKSANHTATFEPRQKKTFSEIRHSMAHYCFSYIACVSGIAK